MKLVDNRNNIELYDLKNGYRVAKKPCLWVTRGYMFYFLTKHDNKYLPEIYDDIDHRGKKDNEKGFAFRIQTTSYGSLPTDEIQKVISGFQTALDTIQMIKDTFAEKAQV